MWYDADEKEQYIQELIDNTLFFVQATSFERQCLWVETVQTLKVVKSFENEGCCFSIKIGKYNKEVLYVELCFSQIDGQRIGFYYPTGNVINWEMTRKWAEKTVGNKKWDKISLMGDEKTYGRPAMCNAWNFSHCLAAIREANGAK